MTLYRAAALALLGWYLMVPPTIGDSHEVNRTAPLSQWTIWRSFPRIEGCETAKDRVHKQAFARLTQMDATAHRSRRNRESFCVMCQAQCVADDDPRLAP